MEDASLKLHIAEVNKSKFTPVSEITVDKAAIFLNELKVGENGLHGFLANKFRITDNYF